MKYPEVRLQDYEAVYEYFSARKPNPRLARTVHRLSSLIFRPHVAYEDDAEITIAKHLNNDGRLLLAAHHSKGTDPLILAAIAQQEKALRPLITNTIIPGHVGLFGYAMLRPVFDNFVAIPTFRSKDVAKLGLPEEEAKQLQVAATGAWQELHSKQANEGMNIAIFPQGSRSARSIRPGIGQIACNIDNSERFRIIPVAIDYAQTSTSLYPNAFIGMPQAIAGTPEEVVEQVESSLSFCVAEAKKM